MKQYRLSSEDTERIALLRASCSACGGNPAKCLEGTSEPFYLRLKGCSAFAQDGSVVPEVKATKQPWQIAA